jgi:hypothetical protein
VPVYTGDSEQCCVSVFYWEGRHYAQHRLRWVFLG